jgi:hypothetical protein
MDTMNKATLAILAALFASIALADDFKTINGREYKNATVSRVERDGIVLKSKSGKAGQQLVDAYCLAREGVR